MLGLNVAAEEDGGVLVEIEGVLSGQVTAVAASCDALLHLGMALQVVLEAVGHIFALCHQSDVTGTELAQFAQQEGIVCATEYDGVDVGVAREQLVDVFLNEVINTRTVVLLVLDQGNPHGAGLTGDSHAWVQFAYLYVVGVTADGALCGKDAYMAVAGETAYNLGCGTYDAQHTAIGINRGQVALLNGAQRLGRGRVAGQDDQRTPHLEEATHGLQREFIDYLERACAVWRTGIVAQIQIVVFGHQLLYLAKHGQSAIA